MPCLLALPGPIPHLQLDLALLKLFQDGSPLARPVTGRELSHRCPPKSLDKQKEPKGPGEMG